MSIICAKEQQYKATVYGWSGKSYKCGSSSTIKH